MKKYVALLLCAAILLVCASCSQSITDTEGDNSSTPSNINLADSSRTQSESDIGADTDSKPGKESDPSVAEDGIGGEDFCMVHKFLYHSYSTQLLNYVGYENFQKWSKSMQSDPPKEMSIVTFVEHFQIPKETLIAVERATYTDDFAEYDGVTMLSLEQIDAIYSGDKRLINEAFCGPLAFVNEADGELYSIYWLEEHTAEDYAAAGLPLEQVEAVLEAAASGDYGDQSQRITAIEPALTQAYALEKAALAAEKEGLAADSSEPAAEQEGLPAEDTLSEDGNTTE